MNLTNKDYQKIVKYYNIPKTSNKSYKQIGEQILADKLCKCIKSIGIINKSEDSAISICRNSIFNKKKLGMYKFECKSKYKLLFKNGTRNKLYKTSKRLKLDKIKKTNRKRTRKRKM